VVLAKVLFKASTTRYNLVLLGASDRRRCMRRETADRQAAKDAGKETQEKQTVPSCYLEQRNKRKGIRETHVARPQAIKK